MSISSLDIHPIFTTFIFRRELLVHDERPLHDERCLVPARSEHKYGNRRVVCEIGEKCVECYRFCFCVLPRKFFFMGR